MLHADDAGPGVSSRPRGWMTGRSGPHLPAGREAAIDRRCAARSDASPVPRAGLAVDAEQSSGDGGLQSALDLRPDDDIIEVSLSHPPVIGCC